MSLWSRRGEAGEERGSFDADVFLRTQRRIAHYEAFPIPSPLDPIEGFGIEDFTIDHVLQNKNLPCSLLPIRFYRKFLPGLRITYVASCSNSRAVHLLFFENVLNTLYYQHNSDSHSDIAGLPSPTRLPTLGPIAHSHGHFVTMKRLPLSLDTLRQ
jgi:hypothetical protein